VPEPGATVQRTDLPLLFSLRRPEPGRRDRQPGSRWTVAPVNRIDIRPCPVVEAGMADFSERLLAILDICRELNAQRDLPVLLDRIAREAARLLEADRASVFLLDDEKHELWTQVALGSEPFRFDARLGVAGSALATGATLNVPDARIDPRFWPGIDERFGYRTRNLLAVPLRDHTGRAMGAFEVLNRKSGAFTAQDERLLEAFAGQAAVAIETAQLVGELERHRDELRSENDRLRHEVEDRFSVRAILGSSSKVQKLVRIIEQIRDTLVDVLITGESGTGKELVARAIHQSSARARRPFVALNCAALPETLLESELFGIEKGVATGVDRKAGKFEEASGGTLFLDEIGDLGLAAQAKILRVLEERNVRRVGGRRSIPVDVRILAATNKDLVAEVKRGTFRADLYYRLDVIHLGTVALREMREDLPLLAQHFLDAACREHRRPRKTLREDALARLRTHPWPGNVRELRNEMQRVAVLAPGRSVGAGDLSEEVRTVGTEPSTDTRHLDGVLRERVEALERGMIAEALATHRHNRQRAAAALGLSRQGLLNKMKRYGVGTTPA